eukprot:88478-Ditylum_brightwellii.AAC.1
MKGYKHPRHPLVLGNKEVGNYAKALGKRFYDGPDDNPVATSHLNKAAAQSRKRQIIQLDVGEEFPSLQEANGTVEITNNTTKHRMESKSNMQEETKKQTAPKT